MGKWVDKRPKGKRKESKNGVSEKDGDGGELGDKRRKKVGERGRW